MHDINNNNKAPANMLNLFQKTTKNGKHQRSKQTDKDLCWKALDPAH